MGKIIMDTRPIRDKLMAEIYVYCLDQADTFDTQEVLLAYGMPHLIADLITYGNKYGGLPGNPHYSHVSDKLSKQYNCLIDDEFLHFALAEIELAIYTVYGIDTTVVDVHAVYSVIVEMVPQEGTYYVHHGH